jgi:cytochrome oxidase Cu insertion factor (SCO1/SenC/PrrC family)
VVVVLVAAALLGAGAGAMLHELLGRSAGAPATAVGLHGQPAGVVRLHGQATWAAGVRPAPAIALPDQSGRMFALSSTRGHTVALAFFDSHCTQSCPLEGRALAAALRSMPARERPVLVLVSVNPADTPASTRAAMRRWGLASVAVWHWLRGRHAALARVWKAYRIFVAAPAHGDIVHTEALYLIDRRGYERSGYLYPFLPRFVTLDLRVLGGRGRA